MKKLRQHKVMVRRTTIHGSLLLKKIYEWEKKENDTRRTLPTIKEPNSSQHHDDKPPTRSPASTTSPVPTKQRLTARTQCPSPSSMQQDEAIYSIPRYTIVCGVRDTQHATYQDKWFSDSHPACIASDVFVLSIPDSATHRICHILFSQLVHHAHITTH